MVARLSISLALLFLSADLRAEESISPLLENVSLLETDPEELGESQSPQRPSIFDSIRNGERGISIAPVYYGEVFTNTRGGLSTNNATRYLGLLDLPITLDFQRLGWRAPGRFFVLGQHTHGEGLTENFVGDSLFISNIDSFVNITRIGEYGWEADIIEDKVTVRLGKQDVNTEFLRIDTANDFIQSTFGLSPSTAFPTYPNQSMAAVLLVKLNDAWRVGFGIWDAFYAGGNSGISGNGSIFVVGEIEYSYSLADGTFPGKLAFAATYESAGELGGEPVSPVHEYSFQIEQFLWQEEDAIEVELQGLAMFAGYYPRFPGELVPDKSIGDSLIAGLVYTGLIPRRDRDVAGAGVAWVELFKGGTGQETVIEWFYKANVNSHLSIQPDMQYIVSPSGIYRDALVTGLRFILAW
jgi:porin